jgi:hypothetical protein
VQVAVPFTATLVGVQDTATDVTAAAAVFVTVMVAEEVFAVFWIDVAVMVTLPPAGAVAGAV